MDIQLPTSLKPKRLSTKEMWSLYGLLKNGIQGRKEEKYLIDELQKVLNSISVDEYLNSLSLLYGNKVVYKNLSAVVSLNLLVDGLKKNKFFEFCSVIRGLNGSS